MIFRKVDSSQDIGREVVMDIVIIADFCGKLDRSGNGRFVYLADLLYKEHDVEIITSDFIHGSKTYFESKPQGYPYQITMLHESGYPKNVCLRRFYSHFIWGKNVKKYLVKRKKPDVIYCAVPTLQASYEAAKYCEKNNVRFIIDIQDLWPEAFQMVFRVPVLSNMIFAPFKWLADGIYKRADEIVAVSHTYVERALSVNKYNAVGHTVYLGTRLETFDANIQENLRTIFTEVNLTEKTKDEIWLGYCGSLGDSYDINCVICALKELKNRTITPPKFIVMGDGYKRQQFEDFAKENDVDSVFTGRLPYEKMCALLRMCDITVNPIVGSSAASIINKHGDYAASGRPVINTQESQEYRNLIDTYHMGLNCDNGNSGDMADKLEILLKDKALCLEMGRNARCCAEECFDRKNSYNKIIELIEEKYEGGK